MLFKIIEKIGSIFKLDREILKRFWLAVSNFFTLLRLFLVLPIVLEISTSNWMSALVLFVLAGISDFLDGFVARLFDVKSQVGAVLDPLADKVLLLSSFFSLAFFHGSLLAIPKWFLFFLAFRELVIVLGSLFIWMLRGSFYVAPTIWGKLTTCFYLLFISWIFICFIFGWMPQRTIQVAFVVISLFSLFSLIDYIKIGFSQVKEV